jgi:hypothetical protein
MADKLYKGPFDEDMKLIDMQDGTYCERVEAHPPLKLLTDENGDYARLRVDVSETSFWAGKEFRTFQKLSILSLGVVTIRATVGANIVLHETSFYTEGSSIEIELRTGGTADGPWTDMPVIRKNTMTDTPVITSQVAMAYNGTHTGGTTIDLVRVNAGNKEASVAGESSVRGVSPGTYYYVITNTGNQTATVVFAGWWEERV